MSEKITFSGVRLLSFSRNGKKGGVAKFRGSVTEGVCERMGWPVPDERLMDSHPEGDLAATACELIPKDKEMRSHALTLQAQRVNKFEVLRRELEGKNGKGYRHELQFEVQFGDPLGCSKLEGFMLAAGLAKCGLVVAYQVEQQQELPGTRVDMSGAQSDLPNVSPTAEQEAAVAEIEPEGELVEAVQEAARKRGRPRKDVQ
jgi:hypothetical protein